MPPSLIAALPFLLFIVLLALLFAAGRLIFRTRMPIQIRPHLSNLFGALTVLFLCGYGTGINMILLLLLAAPVRIQRHFKARGQPLLQRQALRNTAIWLAAFAAITLAHVYYAHQARSRAEHWVVRIDAFQAEHGHYPQPDQIGFPKPNMLLHPIYMLEDDGTPVLFYRSSFVAFETLHYDFETRQWALRY